MSSDFVALRFDTQGRLTAAGNWIDFERRAAGATDAILLAHGFRNDENDASALYTRFLASFSRHADRPDLGLAGRRFAVAGIFWPSKSFRESFGDDGQVQSAEDQTEAELRSAHEQLEQLRAAEPGHSTQIDAALQLLPDVAGDPDKQDRFVDLILSAVDDSHLDPDEGLNEVRAQAGSELLDKLRFPVVLPSGPAGTRDEGGALGFGSFVGSIFGRVARFLNLATWYIMKNRSGIVGETGVAACVRDLRTRLPQVRVHLVGHSLGGRLMAGCAKSLAQDPVVHIRSLTLLEAAFSHFGLSADNRAGSPGYFRDIISRHVVDGPIIATFSFEDSVVGYAYALASRLAGDNVRAIGDRNDPYGGIGRNGAQNCAEAVEQPLRTAGVPYRFEPGRVLCLDGSGGLIRDHGDVTNDNVTWAFAAAVAAS